jgi:hypothetical protein
MLHQFTHWVEHPHKMLNTLTRLHAIAQSVDNDLSQSNLENGLIPAISAEVMKTFTAISNIETKTTAELSASMDMVPRWYYYFSPLMGLNLSKKAIEAKAKLRRSGDLNNLLLSTNVFPAHAFIIMYFPISMNEGGVDKRLQIMMSTGAAAETLVSKLTSFEVLDFFKTLTRLPTNTIAYQVWVQETPTGTKAWNATHQLLPDSDFIVPDTIGRADAEGIIHCSSSMVIEYIKCMMKVTPVYHPINNNCQMHSKTLAAFAELGEWPRWFNGKCAAQVSKAHFSEMIIPSRTGGAAHTVPRMGYPFGPGKSVAAVNARYTADIAKVAAHGIAHLEAVESKSTDPVFVSRRFSEADAQHYNDVAADFGLTVDLHVR